MVAEIAILVPALLAAGPVVVDSAEPCPRADAVEQKLASLLPLAVTGGEPDRATMVRQAGRLRVRLHRPDGTLVVERDLDATSSCADLADAVAVIIASWIAQHRPEWLPPPALPTAQTDASTSITARAVPVAPSPDRNREVGVALGVGAAGDDVAPALALHGSWWRQRLGVRAAAAGTTFHDRPIGAGAASWSRSSFSLGPAVRLVAKRVRVDLHAEGVLGFTFARGRGLSRAQEDAAFTAGAGAGLDISMAFGRMIVTLGTGATFWPVQQSLVVLPEQTTRAGLPLLDSTGTLGVGLAF